MAALVAFAALTAAVLLAHLWLAAAVLPNRLGEGAADSPHRRIDVSFVRTLAATAAAPAPAVREAPRVRRAVAAAPAASASESAPAAAAPPPLPATAEAVPTAPPEPVPPLPELAVLATLPTAPLLGEAVATAPAASVASVAPAASAAPAAPAAAAVSAPVAFEWPPSTRLSYRLTGDVRGAVEGRARVEWLRSGARYQVFLEASVGPSFAPLMTRRESSEGEITPEGLRPQRYDLEMKVVLRDARRSTIHMDADRVRLPGGTELPRPAGLQDAVSQFVHLTWLFTTQPQRLVVGSSVQWPLALPRRVEDWAYDVVGADSLQTPAGVVEAVHVKPRREARAGDYSAEIWIAPSLQYLPVRIVVRQDASTFIDLQIERLPEQAERER